MSGHRTAAVKVKECEKERSQNEENEEEDECTDDNGGVGFDLGGLRRFPRLGSATARRPPPCVSRQAPLGSEVAHYAHARVLFVHIYLQEVA